MWADLPEPRLSPPPSAVVVGWSNFVDRTAVPGTLDNLWSSVIPARERLSFARGAKDVEHSPSIPKTMALETTRQARGGGRVQRAPVVVLYKRGSSDVGDKARWPTDHV